MTFYSPYTGNALEQFAGVPATILSTAEQYTTLGEAMTTTADTLRDIADSQISLGTDRLKEDAEKLEGDLRKAATRYSQTGTALMPYGDALSEARLWYLQNAESVRQAEQAFLDADSAYSTVLHTPSYGVEDQEQSAEQLGDAQRDRAAAEEERNQQWQAFDSAFEVWATAFETAADGVAEAIDAADNNDGRWDWIADALTVIGWAIIVLAVAALFVVSSPWSAILIGATIALSVAHLAGTVYLYMNGEASLSDVLWSVFGLATAGAGALAGRSIRLATAANGGGDLLQASSQASRLPVFAQGVRTTSMPTLGGPLNPFSVLMRGREWAALNSWGSQLANWTATGARSSTIAADWSQVVVNSVPGVSRAGATAVASWASGTAGGLFTLSPFYTPLGRP